MNFPTRHYDSSSEDSDAIPPTPAAKSTPLVVGNRLRKQSTSSSSSGGQLETPRMSSRPAPAAHDSSSEDEDAPQSTPMVRAMTLKREAPSDSSSDGDHSDTVKKQIMARLDSQPNKRPVHAMSASEESDSDDADASRTIVQNQQNRQDDSSDESDDESENVQAARNVVVKQEKPSMTESSEESDEEPPPPRKIVHTQAQANESSSEESEDEVDQKPVLKSHQAPVNNSSSDESESEEETSRPIPKTQTTIPKQVQANDTSSEESEDEVERKPVIVKSHQTPANHSSSEESDSETEAPQNNINNKSRKDSSDDSSGDDDRVPVRKAPVQPNRQQAPSDSEESENEANTAGPNESFGRQRDYYDSSEDEPSNKSVVEQKFNPVQIPKSMAEKRVEFSRNIPIQQPRLAAAVPDSGHTGLTLLRETFENDDVLEVDSASLSVEDIGSDEEIWLLQCPQSMDIRALKKKNIGLSSENDIQLEDGPTFKRFTVTPQQNSKNSINCLLPNRRRNQFQISCLPIKGKIVINEHVHVPKLRMPEATGKGPVPFPTGLKVRHPLLGTDYKERIAEARKTLEESALHHKRSSKKKKRSLENGYSDYNGSADLSFQSNGKTNQYELYTPQVNNSSDAVSDRKKRKLSLSMNDSDIGNVINKSEKKKHKASKRDSISEDSVNETVDGKAVSKKNKSSSRQNSLSNIQDESSLETSSKKKKSKKGDEGNLSGVVKQFSWHTPQEEEKPVCVVNKDDSHSKKKKKKHSKELLDPSEIKKEKLDSSENGISEMPNSEAKAKKRKRKDYDLASVTLDPCHVPSKKKKYSL